MRLNKNWMLYILTLSMWLVGAPAMAADLTANLSVSSDYVWRGKTQTGGEAAVSGGVDYSYDANVYFGTWMSNTNVDLENGGCCSSELDLYAGYTGDYKKISYDVGFIMYRYPQAASSENFEEFYGGVSYKQFSGKLSFSSDKGSYLEGAVDFELPKKFLLTLHIGKYDYKSKTGTKDYTDFNASLNKGDITFTISDTDTSGTIDDDMKFFVAWSKNFDL